MDTSARSSERIGERDYDHIVEAPGCTLVDFKGCDAREVATVYQALAVRLMESDLERVLVCSGTDSPEGHVALLDALKTVIRHRGVCKQFRLALVAQSARARWVFEQVARPYQQTGLQVRLFDGEPEARAWLAG